MDASDYVELSNCQDSESARKKYGGKLIASYRGKLVREGDNIMAESDLGVFLAKLDDRGFGMEALFTRMPMPGWGVGSETYSPAP
jgi:hypothetical protein